MNESFPRRSQKDHHDLVNPVGGGRRGREAEPDARVFLDKGGKVVSQAKGRGKPNTTRLGSGGQWGVEHSQDVVSVSVERSVALERGKSLGSFERAREVGQGDGPLGDTAGWMEVEEREVTLSLSHTASKGSDG